MATVKTAFSVEKPLFERTEEMAREMKVPRSRVFNQALREFFSRHDERELVARINAACEEGTDPDEEELKRHLSVHYRRLAKNLW